MTDKEKQILNEKIAKWAGFHKQRYDEGSWRYPNERYHDHLHPPNFCDYMDDITKWIFPKLLNYSILFYYFNHNTRIEIQSIAKMTFINASGATLSRSFCYALSELIDTEKSKRK